MILKRKKYNIADIYNLVSSLSFNNYPIGIKINLLKRLSKNSITKIMSADAHHSIGPTLLVLLRNVQPTSIDVERSISLLGNLLRDDRRFEPENIISYMICYYNK